ncbi:YdcF family protein [Phytoactinopolyspora endophytica]|uniref:YdcF family protein n=1 Tax=Phytoactinopolyspora endophytica TaxID=1642495 RepID=UPI00101BC979|nr:YdcF family protein [Phytoactinopolyspora endophytica]
MTEQDERAVSITPHTRGDMNRIAGYLARRDIPSLSTSHGPERLDVLVLCGSAVLSAIDSAAAAFQDGLVPRILVSGGIGHSTPYLRRAVDDHPRYRGVPSDGRSEAAVIAEILHRHHDVPALAIMNEDKASNCGENAEFSVDVLMRDLNVARSILLIQDPTMQRRTHENFRRALRRMPGARVWSYAPFVPSVTHDDGGGGVRDADGNVVWSRRRLTSLLLGEMRRLYDDEHGYGPNGTGFIDHVDVPEEVVAAYARLRNEYPGAVRLAL